MQNINKENKTTTQFFFLYVVSIPKNHNTDKIKGLNAKLQLN